ncbi:protein of unknown function (plasmid) [Rhodovastum atsumiense]|nr:protein of unknown function [Rhodovastum atsumiense]
MTWLHNFDNSAPYLISTPHRHM